MVEAIASGAALGVLSLLHCVSMCSPLAAFACTRASGRASALRYQVGRTVGYGFLGALSGRLGHVLGAASSGFLPRGVFSIVIVLACVLAALTLWHKPEPTTALVQIRIGRPNASIFATLASLVPREPAVLGMLTALLPCGALATAALAAAATGSAVLGACLMLGFVSASAPALLGAGLLTRFVPAQRSGALRRVLAVALVVCALLLAVRPIQAFFPRTSGQAAAHHCH